MAAHLNFFRMRDKNSRIGFNFLYRRGGGGFVGSFAPLRFRRPKTKKKSRWQPCFRGKKVSLDPCAFESSSLFIFIPSCRLPRPGHLDWNGICRETEWTARQVKRRHWHSGENTAKDPCGFPAENYLSFGSNAKKNLISLSFLRFVKMRGIC